MSSSGSSSSSNPPGPYQEQLENFCRGSGIRPPNFQVISDRRGGRTAWSCIVTIQGQQLSARFWYDGQYVKNAYEDVSQVALQRFGQLPPAGTPASSQTQQQGQQGGAQSPPQSPQQQRNYGVIGS